MKARRIMANWKTATQGRGVTFYTASMGMNYLCEQCKTFYVRGGMNKKECADRLNKHFWYK